MEMFTLCGHIKNQNKITDFLMILVWASPFNEIGVIMLLCIILLI